MLFVIMLCGCQRQEESMEPPEIQLKKCTFENAVFDIPETWDTEQIGSNMYLYPEGSESDEQSMTLQYLLLDLSEDETEQVKEVLHGIAGRLFASDNIQNASSEDTDLQGYTAVKMTFDEQEDTYTIKKTVYLTDAAGRGVLIISYAHPEDSSNRLHTIYEQVVHSVRFTDAENS